MIIYTYPMRLILEGGKLRLGRHARIVALLNVHSAGRSSEVHLHGQLLGGNFQHLLTISTTSSYTSTEAIILRSTTASTTSITS